VFDDPRFEVTFRFPDRLPGGTARRIDDDLDGAPRVHVSTEDGRLYVEILRLDPMTADEEYARHRPVLEARFGPGSVSALSGTTLAGRTGRAYTFRWPGHARQAILVTTPDALYRVVVDPTSVLDQLVLDTMRWRS
jgi:hypothetical protein